MSMTALFPELCPAVQSGFTFPVALTEKYQPKRIHEFIGLERPRKQMTNLAKCPRNVGGWVFLGPSGTGKTSMAYALAREMNAEIHHIPAKDCTLETLSKVRYSCNYVPMAPYKKHLVIVDEADGMSVAAQESLLSELDGRDATPETIFVFTCNSVDRFTDRFLSRNRQIDFSSYGIAKAAADFIERVWDAETAALEPKPNFARIVKEANNNIRGALMSLELEIMAA